MIFGFSPFSPCLKEDFHQKFIQATVLLIPLAVRFHFLKNVSTSSSSISGPNLRHRGNSASISMDQYFHIWGQVTSHPGPALSHPNQYFHLKSFCSNFIPELHRFVIKIPLAPMEVLASMSAHAQRSTQDIFGAPVLKIPNNFCRRGEADF